MSLAFTSQIQPLRSRLPWEGWIDPSADTLREAGMTDRAGSSEEVATLGGGCFWCLEAVYQQLRGVKKVESGYVGGHVSDPSYSQVSSGTTGHAEVVRITYNSAQISFRELLQIFFTIHDPTTLNGQGADVGTQYRSAIFYHGPEQQKVAIDVIDALREAGIWGKPIVTEVVPSDAFYEAEDYHQEYYRRNRGQPYCRLVIDPKMAKFRQKYMASLKREFVTD